MKHLPHRHGEVPVGFKVLWQSSVVPSMDSPVGIEVVESGRVRPATSQHGRSTGGTHGLLREGKHSVVQESN